MYNREKEILNRYYSKLKKVSLSVETLHQLKTAINMQNLFHEKFDHYFMYKGNVISYHYYSGIIMGILIEKANVFSKKK
jgi:hypothetical protein